MMTSTEMAAAPESMRIEQLKRIIEAALLASSHPMTVNQLSDLFQETDEVGNQQIAQALESLGEDCQDRGVELKEVASGFRYQVRQDVHPWISRMWTEKPSRYSRALLETLALIAYRQPITRPEIEQIRGVVVSSNIIKTMEEREWIRVVGHRDVPGRPALFGTTRAFLDYFNLKSLDQLPPLSEIRDMEDPQLRFEQEPLPAHVVRDLPIDPDQEASPGSEAVVETEANSATDTKTDTDADDDSETEAVDSATNSDTPSAGNNTVDHQDTTASSETQAISSGTDEISSEPSDSSEPPTTTTADEAANPAADVDPDADEQDTEEYRA